MSYHEVGIVEFLESLFLGLSCLVGGEQFHMYVSQTDASLRSQYYVFILISLFILFASIIFFDEDNPDFLNVLHFGYCLILGILFLLQRQKSRSASLITVMTALMSIVLTFLVVEACINYSTSKYLLMTFVLGLFGSRLLPSLCWFLVREKQESYDVQLHSASYKMCLLRLIMCVSSMSIKIVEGRFGMSINKTEGLGYDLIVIRRFPFVRFFELFKNIPFTIFSIFSFYGSLLLFFGYYPLLDPIIKNSDRMIFDFGKLDDVFHILGLCLGTIFPASFTSNPAKFYLISIGLYSLFCVFVVLSYFEIFTIGSSIILGYISSYTLMSVINSTINKTCKFEEVYKYSCCGEIFNKECYCRFPQIVRSRISYSNLRKFKCSQFIQNSNLYYSSEGRTSILICLGGSDVLGNLNCCESTCSECCSGSKNCCLKLFGIYGLKTVTTKTCENCQLTVRLEAKKICDCTDCCTGGCKCCCSEDKKCSCICVKCCSEPCGTSNCCCIKLCCCKNGTCGASCKCNSGIYKGTRVFICYKNGKNCCCIRELKPNVTPEFDGDLKTQNEFYIKNIFLSDCCHVDLQVDLHCSLKNHFFRLTGVGYKMKSTYPVSLALSKRPSENCSKENCCCCCKIPLVKLCLTYPGQSEEDVCKNDKKCNCSGCPSKCGCCKDGKCCCCLVCKIPISEKDAFNIRIQPVRVKLVFIVWFLFAILMMISSLFNSYIKVKKLKYYNFNPVTSYKCIKNTLDKNKLNSVQSVCERISPLVQGNKTETIETKKSELSCIMKLCEQVFDNGGIESLKTYVLQNSNSLMNNPSFKDKTLGVDVVMWSYCIGFLHTYISSMFMLIQTYFIKWEEVWIREYHNYRKLMTPRFNGITHKSKFALSLMSELNVNYETHLLINRERTSAWSEAYQNLDQYIQLYDREVEILEQKPPYRIDLRLEYFLDRWSHRVEFIKTWVNNNKNLYDWSNFIDEYPNLRNWVDSFRWLIHSTALEVKFTVDELDKGTEVFVNYKIK